MAWENLHLGDFGHEGRLKITQGGTAQDISSYTTLQFELRPSRDGAIKTVNAEFLTDGVDGWLKYVFQAGDIDVAGNWRVRAVVSKTGARLTSDWHSFVAEP